MKFMLSGLLLINWVGIVLSNSPCILERNEYNEYPWMIKLYWERTWGHGSLTAPNRVLSAYEPFTRASKKISVIIQSLDFIATMRGPDGKVSCTARRKGKALFKEGSTRRQLIGHWELTEDFDVGNDYPFLFKDPKGINQGDIQQDLRDTRQGESCYVPLFEDEQGDGTGRLSIVEVKLTNLDDCKNKYPRTVGVAKDEFCVIRPYRARKLSVHAWEAGAVILCRKKPLGIIREASHPVFTVCVSLASAAQVLKNQFDSWLAKSRTNTTATTTMNRTITVATITATIPNHPDEKELVNDGESVDTEPSFEESEESTDFISVIPEAPTKTRPPTSKHDGVFIGTPPLKAKYITRRSSGSPRTGNGWLIRTTAWTIVLQLFHQKYTSHA